ncbi:unnamed protein product, partial [Dovyalis caffra]
EDHFLLSAIAIIDVSDGKLVLRVGDEELCIIQGEEDYEDDPIRVEQVACLEATEFMVRNKAFKEIDRCKETRLKPSIEDPPNLELKALLETLRICIS